MKQYKVAVIGAGNMGGAIACGLAHGKQIRTQDIIAANPGLGKLEHIKERYPEIQITQDNTEAARKADIVILAVKPWKAAEVLTEIQMEKRQLLVSVAAGISCQELESLTQPGQPIVRAIPNTAISERESLTLLCTLNTDTEQTQAILDLFNELGMAMLINEELVPATCALTSCGIAYVFKYVQAAMQGGTELGVPPKDSMKMLAQTLKGAAEILLRHPDTHPAIEIDKVTTPGGITIKGINSLEHSGFVSAVIQAIKSSSL